MLIHTHPKLGFNPAYEARLKKNVARRQKEAADKLVSFHTKLVREKKEIVGMFAMQCAGKSTYAAIELQFMLSKPMALALAELSGVKMSFTTASHAPTCYNVKITFLNGQQGDVSKLELVHVKPDSDISSSPKHKALFVSAERAADEDYDSPVAVRTPKKVAKKAAKKPAAK